MVEQATVLYDFAGLPESGEICLKEGDIVTITNKSIGDGWWEGSTPSGHTGLFPEAYVELIPAAADSNDVPPSPNPTYSYADEIRNKNATSPVHIESNYDTLPARDSYPANEERGFDEEDWDDSSSVATTATLNTPMPFVQDVTYGSPNNTKLSRAPSTMSKNFNRFSSFVKHGGEDFILGKATAQVKHTDQIQIVIDEDGPRWKENDQAFTCVVENPKQQSKMKGLKKFICYNLTPSNTAVTVQRRYKQFDWLYTRLVERYPLVAIPKLPDKQASGRFEEDFIEGRMAKLKLWVAFVCRHPVLSRSKLFHNFLTLTEQKAWKVSKRLAEKDQLTAANFFLTITLPPTITTLSDAEAQLELFKKTAKGMDEAISQYSHATVNMANKYMSVFKKEYQSFGRSLTYLADSFSLHLNESNKNLTIATRQAGQAFSKIGEMFYEQPKEDFHLMSDRLWLYNNLISAMPDLWHVQTGATRKVKECRKLTEEEKMTEAECGAVAERADRVACCMRSEISHFHQERIRDFTIDQRYLIVKQAEFFERIAAELRSTLQYFDNVHYEP